MGKKFWETRVIEERYNESHPVIGLMTVADVLAELHPLRGEIVRVERYEIELREQPSRFAQSGMVTVRHETGRTETQVRQRWTGGRWVMIPEAE